MSAAPVPDEVVAESAQYQSPGFSAAIPETPLSPAPGTPDWTALPPQQPPPAGALRDEHCDVQHYEHHEHYEHREHNEPTLVDTTQERVPEPSPPQLPLEVPPPPSVQSDVQESQGSEGNLLPQKRPAAVLVNTFLANYDVHDNGEITLKDYDTTENNQVPFQRNYYYRCYLASSTRKDELAKAGVLEEPQREDETTDEENLTASNDRTRSRQAQAARPRDPLETADRAAETAVRRVPAGYTCRERQLDELGRDSANIPPRSQEDNRRPVHRQAYTSRQGGLPR